LKLSEREGVSIASMEKYACMPVCQMPPIDQVIKCMRVTLRQEKKAYLATLYPFCAKDYLLVMIYSTVNDMFAEMT